ncbi:hypothetical protein GWO43_26195 [candidate division KSB1 bacterium]|nr:hypothetical protein [candidate division KSB1 bacterium]NIV69276.1 hypothetical protein [Phycisphaerae bacterium]NIR70777.1 hypothetical protein [candidate division KSB1 bacterium]NIS27449.1 hypothetical protein [candidate division KSB1 bacterium]NIT74302.1 hypothetical protein [candidate division KSB1 bacterium]
MQKLISLTFVVVLLTLFLGCAGSSASSGGGSKIYRANLGIATFSGLRDQTQRLLVNKHHYIIQYFDESTDRFYVETEWKDRSPFADEVQQGVLQARSRVILEGRPRIHAGRSSKLKIKFRGENLLLFSDSGQWERGHMSKQARENFKELANELKHRFSTMVREF